MPDAKAGIASAPKSPVTPPQAANDSVVDLPLHGRIAAGMPIEALEGQSSLAVPAALLGPGEHYALEVSGDSMVEAGILDGDYALIRSTNTARDGEIVVALIADHEATLKYFRKEGAMIRLDPANRARALEVLRMPEALAGKTPAATSAGKAKAPAAPPHAANENVLDIPLHGRIAAGLPIEALEGQSTLSVPAALLGPGEHYALEVSGDSMVEAGILDGDYALIRKAETARDGDIIVALIADSEATLKYFRKEGAMIRLDPANRAYDPQRYKPDQVRVQGKLAGLLRRY